MQLTDKFSLYIHIPWCYKKCPYCDFNAYDQNVHQPDFKEYFKNLTYELFRIQAHYPWKKKITSIYFGGGTPSLAPSALIKELLGKINLMFDTSCCDEITMEVSPRSPQENLSLLRSAGINRFSLGLQSFQEKTLKALGREHTTQMIDSTLRTLLSFSDTRLNIDLIYGLEEQSIEMALSDLKTACELGIEHLSWYELTIEPNTLFAKYDKKKMQGDLLEKLYVLGKQTLIDYGFEHYEVSAFTRQRKSKHNCSYWNFDDYIGIGAGAHSKVSVHQDSILRSHVTRFPKDYLRRPRLKYDYLTSDDLDYLLCRLRIKGLISYRDIKERVPSNKAEKVISWLEKRSKALNEFIEKTDQGFEVKPRALEMTLSLLEDYNQFS